MIGYGVMPEEIANLLNRIRLPFNTNSLAQAGAGAALEDTIFFKKSLALVHEDLDFLYDALDRLGIKYFPTQTNFFLIDVVKMLMKFTKICSARCYCPVHEILWLSQLY